MAFAHNRWLWLGLDPRLLPPVRSDLVECAKRALSRLPEIVSEYQNLAGNGIKSLASIEAAQAACEATPGTAQARS